MHEENPRHERNPSRATRVSIGVGEGRYIELIRDFAFWTEDKN
jgi:hypothetical protein